MTLRRLRPVLRTSDESWGQAGGCALLTCGSHKATVDWLADWQARRGVKSWMLFNLATAQRRAG